MVGEVRSTFITTRRPFSRVAFWTCRERAGGVGGTAALAGFSAGGALGLAAPALLAGPVPLPFCACLARLSCAACRGLAWAVPAAKRIKAGSSQAGDRGRNILGDLGWAPA